MPDLTLQDEHYPLEQLEFRFHAAGPIELDALGDSFVALSQAFDRHLQQHFTTEPRPPVKLFITKVEHGSIIATIAPFLVLMTEPLVWMTATNTITTFSRNFISLLKRFSGDEKSTTPATIEEARTFQTFLKPLIGRNSAQLGITRARYEERNGSKEIIVEYEMASPQINIAASNLSKVIEARALLDAPQSKHVTKTEVRMKFYQVNEMPGKDKGRTGDRAIVPDVSDRDLPLYFPKQSNEFKSQILERTENPFLKNYIVDVDVEYDGDTPKMYRLLHLHQIVDP